MFLLPTLFVPRLLVGALLLTLGRRLFWLIVGGAGFLAGLQLAPQILRNQSPTVILVAAVVLGLVGALLAVIVQRFAVGLAGFVIGGWAAVYIARALGLVAAGAGGFPGGTPGGLPAFPTASAAVLTAVQAPAAGLLPAWLVFVVGGIVGAILVAALFDLALIVLSSIAGSALITESLPIGSALALFVFLALIVVGFLIQLRLFSRR